jgi:hypothetical protein
MLPFNCALVCDRDPRLLTRDHNTFVRNAYHNAAEYHHRQHIPRHFTADAAHKYGYAPRRSMANAGVFEAVGLEPWHAPEPRNQPYQAFKDRLGLPPNVLSGALRDQVTTQHRITATSTRGARLEMPAPDYAGGVTGRLRIGPGQTSPSVQQENLLARQAEIETISPDEHTALQAVIETDYTKAANAPGVHYRQKVI